VKVISRWVPLSLGRSCGLTKPPQLKLVGGDVPHARWSRDPGGSVDHLWIAKRARTYPVSWNYAIVSAAILIYNLNIWPGRIKEFYSEKILRLLVQRYPNQIIHKKDHDFHYHFLGGHEWIDLREYSRILTSPYLRGPSVLAHAQSAYFPNYNQF
jgi:hypothetical protein